jgi:hypothetical protein
MATSTERMRALRERQRRGLRRLTLGRSSRFAKRHYEGAVTTDQRAQLSICPHRRTLSTAPADRSRFCGTPLLHATQRRFRDLLRCNMTFPGPVAL